MTKTDTLESALVAAQAEMDNATLNQQNPHFKSKFADLRAVRAATLPILNKHGLGISQQTMLDPENGFHLVTRLFHASGSAIEARYPLPANGKPQEIGSAITYARRYSWAAMCGIAADEDDDGNAAQQTTGNAAKNGRGPDYGKAASAKRGGDWEALQADLAECGSVVALDRLQADYEQNTYPKWNRDWREQAHEAFEKRRDELEKAREPQPVPASKQAQGRQKLSGAAADTLRDELLEVIAASTEYDALNRWGAAAEVRQNVGKLPTEHQLAVSNAFDAKLDELSAVSLPDHLEEQGEVV